MSMLSPDLIVAVGAFGVAVARSLTGPATHVVRVPVSDDGISIPPEVTTLLLAASVPAPHLELQLSEAAHSQSVDFIPIVLEHPRLRVGPVSHAGSRGCSSCYRHRIRQHAVDPLAQDALEEHFRRAPEAAERGFPAHWPALAAGLARQVDLADNVRVHHVDLLSNTPAMSRLVPVHGCGVCAPAPAQAPRQRSVARLVSVVEGTIAE
ncbi:TOMM precursor leader peptide-binding protein [Nonomuraea sp. NPDC004186]